MADQLEQKRDDRSFVMYLTAPSKSGKTSSILPAFLKSAERNKDGKGFTHYIYIAFKNNNKRNFSFLGLPSSLHDNPRCAEKQGGYFMKDCF